MTSARNERFSSRGEAWFFSFACNSFSSFLRSLFGLSRSVLARSSSNSRYHSTASRLKSNSGRISGAKLLHEIRAHSWSRDHVVGINPIICRISIRAGYRYRTCTITSVPELDRSLTRRSTERRQWRRKCVGHVLTGLPAPISDATPSGVSPKPSSRASFSLARDTVHTCRIHVAIKAIKRRFFLYCPNF